MQTVLINPRKKRKRKRTSKKRARKNPVAQNPKKKTRKRARRNPAAVRIFGKKFDAAKVATPIITTLAGYAGSAFIAKMIKEKVLTPTTKLPIPAEAVDILPAVAIFFLRDKIPYGDFVMIGSGVRAAAAIGRKFAPDIFGLQGLPAPYDEVMHIALPGNVRETPQDQETYFDVENFARKIENMI